MQQQIGGFQFLKGGLKSFGQFLWEVADKSDRIRQHKFVLFGEAEPPGGGVQRGEQLVFRQHLGAGQGVEERRFSGVGVAHQARPPANPAGRGGHG